MSQLIECHACRRQIDARSAFCPACGKAQIAMATKKMGDRDKAWLFIAGLVGLIMVAWVLKAMLVPDAPTQADPSGFQARPSLDPMIGLASQVEILSWHWEPRMEGSPYVNAVGELKNNSSVPLGVVIRITSRNKAGQVISSDDVFLTKDLVPPGGTRSFSYPVTDNGIDQSNGEVAVVRVKQ